MTIYDGYSRARVGWFFGLTARQAGAMMTATFPVLWAIRSQSWTQFIGFSGLWLIIALLVLVPVRGRSATSWLMSTAAFTTGTLTGRTRFRSHAATGRGADLSQPDLPGVLSSIEIHEGPPTGPGQERLAVIQNHATRTWAMTAAVVHPGIRMADASTRDRLGTGLAELLELCSRSDLIDEVMFIVRTVPDDGAERLQWIRRHRRQGSPDLSRRVNDDLQQVLAGAAVRTETFVTITIPDARLAKEAKDAGQGLDGRFAVLYLLAGEVEAQLTSAVGMSEVSWLTSPDLAAACRTGFSPADRAAMVDATTAAATESGVNTEVPWALAGPSGADNVLRHYAHDSWNSISATVKLPERGIVMGALSLILTPTEPGERRSFVAAFPVLSADKAARQSRTSEWGADIADALREKAKVKQHTRERDESLKVRGLDSKLARGSALTQPYAVVTVTVPHGHRVGEFGRRLDSSIRRAGFAPLRLDLAQDVAFAASSVPLGISLTNSSP